jgi:hypothetical protein
LRSADRVIADIAIAGGGVGGALESRAVVHRIDDTSRVDPAAWIMPISSGSIAAALPQGSYV